MLCNLSEELLKKEFNRIKDECYLDHTGAALYTQSQIEMFSKDLCENLYGNPHSNNIICKNTYDLADQVRFRILQHFNTNINEYSVIFTSGATESLRIVAETFNFVGKASKSHLNDHKLDEKYPIDKCDYSDKHGQFFYTLDNHTSVLGMRYTDNVGQVHCCGLSHEETFQIFSSYEIVNGFSKIYDGNSLFVYPAQCNFSGIKYPLKWVKDVHNGALNKLWYSKWFCMLDAATFVSTSQLDLSMVSPDFVCISFYKMFGLPTGLGALLVRNSSAYTLQKKYFGGGTVEVALPSKKVHVLRKNLHERFEDGTINFLSIVALNHGLDSLKRLGLTMTMISNHSFTLAQYLHGKMLTMHHNNGQRAVKLYCDTDFSDEAIQGGIVNFNMLRSDGCYIGYTEVINLASLHNISLRTGCFCNPGACHRHLGLSEDQYYDYYKAGHVCGDDRDLIHGRPTGSVRVSFSYYTTYKHLNTLIDMLVNCFVTSPVIYKVPDSWEEEKYELRKKFKPYLNLNTFTHVKTTNYNGDLKQLKENGTDSIANNHPETNKDLTLSHIFIYPIKSCGCFEVFDTWNLDDKGLAFDRLWMITTSTGVALTQKQEPKMCLIKPVIDLTQRFMVLTFKGHPSCSIPLDSEPSITEVHSLCQSKVCTDYVQGVDCGDSVAEWLSKVLNKPGLRLIKQWDEEVRRKTKTDNVKLSLANQAQFLIITEASVGWLADQIQDTSSCSKESMLHRFRSNFVVQGKITAFGEQNWSQVHIGNNEFKVIGPCGRCQMICIDQETGDRTKEPLTILSASLKGKIKFGVYLSQIDSFKYSKISIGDKITSNSLENNAFLKK